MQTLLEEVSVQENLDKNCAIQTINSEIDTIINLHKITNTFTVEDNKPVGVIHIRDLLNNGVA